jgi:prepilin-type N-terminal cleavage/methylation domain-containing protein
MKKRCVVRPMRERQQHGDGGFTLLEILLAMAILLIGLTAVFQTTRSALQRMALSKELTEAQNACQAVLNELLARSSPIQPEVGRTIEHLPHCKMRVDVYPTSQSGLYVVHLSAQQFSPEGTLLGVRYQLLRWVPAERVQFPESRETFSGNEFEDLFR